MHKILDRGSSPLKEGREGGGLWNYTFDPVANRDGPLAYQLKTYVALLELFRASRAAFVAAVEFHGLRAASMTNGNWR